LVFAAASIDLLLQIDRASERRLEGGIACRYAFHAGWRVTVAIGA